MMMKSSMPNMPGAGAMTDTLEFMKKLWGGITLPGASMPGMVMPTLSVEEIDKQIADLKAVESWLTMNMNMLGGTIKALEVQSATIATLQSMSANFSSAMKPAEPAPTPQPSPYEAFFRAASAKTEAAPAQAPAPAPAPAPQAAPVPEAAAELPPIANPNAWWNMLQQQFQQAVANAIPPEPVAAPKPASAPKAASTAKPAAAAKPRPVKKPTAAAKPEKT
ncbi:PhaM family polyhydroxyalkanoate granule multifunctional regulatory protein [Actimicrobium sp. CCI2.3]|uniref:PhaM family polyhydroxyalkanoate granule multifunctional regulatory protein n=1 Tax=Actimicrobium sp. CCI2.3 TaxID=3048616 RepID=UPI002AB3DBA3|nr:PhaM family polyhydroxyalkanoate granule multifunctional regulatory protein [Actimicrobium sp. CCI2.3]MDY7576325.1 hypothetical protein [Actimicrobium sp. CCI2.3]MEB0020471.1 hypothetical protein [Actimicrobium sp. CCI2.3]